MASACRAYHTHGTRVSPRRPTKVPPERYFGLIDAFLDTHDGRTAAQALNHHGLPQPGTTGGTRTESTYDGRETAWAARKAKIFLATDDAGYQQAILRRYGAQRVAQLNDGKVCATRREHAHTRSGTREVYARSCGACKLLTYQAPWDSYTGGRCGPALLLLDTHATHPPGRTGAACGRDRCYLAAVT